MIQPHFPTTPEKLSNEAMDDLLQSPRAVQSIIQSQKTSCNPLMSFTPELSNQESPTSKTTKPVMPPTPPELSNQESPTSKTTKPVMPTTPPELSNQESPHTSKTTKPVMPFTPEDDFSLKSLKSRYATNS